MGDPVSPLPSHSPPVTRPIHDDEDDEEEEACMRAVRRGLTDGDLRDSGGAGSDSSILMLSIVLGSFFLPEDTFFDNN